MSLILSEVKTGNDYGRVEDGTYPARVVQVIDFGTQKQTDYKTGEETDPKPRVMITWEFPTSRIELEKDGVVTEKPRWLGKEYTVSTFDKSNLMKLLQALAPKAVSLDELLNVPCMVQVGSTSGGNAKVMSVMPAPNGVPVAELENETTMFDFSHPTKELFSALPNWQKNKIKDAVDYNGFADEWDSDTANDGEF